MLFFLSNDILTCNGLPNWFSFATDKPLLSNAHLYHYRRLGVMPTFLTSPLQRGLLSKIPTFSIPCR